MKCSFGRVSDGGYGAAFGLCQGDEGVGQLFDDVAVAHPDAGGSGYVGQQGSVVYHG